MTKKFIRFANGSKLIYRGDVRGEKIRGTDLYLWEMSGTPTKDGDILIYTDRFWDMSTQEDIIVIKHTVACCRCGKANVVTLDRGDDIVYLDDILQADGWTKDQYGRWFCDDCSYKGGDD